MARKTGPSRAGTKSEPYRSADRLESQRLPGHKKPRPIQVDEVEQIIDSLAGDVAAVSLTVGGAQAAHRNTLERLIERLADEPLAILARNPIVGTINLENMSYKKAYDLRRDYSHVAAPGLHKGFRVPALSTLELASADLRVRLYTLHRIPTIWLPATWREEKNSLELALRAFVTERDVDLTRRGEKFREGPRRERWDTLARLMTNAYLDLRKKNSEPTARKVWWYLPKMDPLKMVITDEPTDDALTYLKKGELEDINFKAFEKRYSRLLAKLRKQNLPPLID